MIEFQRLHKSYAVAGRAVSALQPLDLTIEAGEVFGIIGHSGAGKSTLIRMINRLEEPSGGRLLIGGEDVTALDADGLRALRRRIGMIFQHFNLLSSRTVAGNVAFPLELAGTPKAEIDARVVELLQTVGPKRMRRSIRRSCPVARSSASALPAHLQRVRRSCCATRPPVRSIRRPRHRCCRCCRRSIASWA